MFAPTNKQPTAHDAESFPAELPPRPEGRGMRRMCPGYRAFWPGFSIASYSLKTGGDKELLIRRLCMIAILLIRTANSIFVLVLDVLWHHWVQFIIGIIISIVGFLIVAHCLHLIGSMSGGSRRVLGMSMTKRSYDMFLFVMVFLHLGIFAMTFFVNFYIYDGVWFIFGILIFLAAWTTTWEPETQPMVVGP